jgi:ATP-dependent Clp protease ATP-binding subunit ClpX
MQKVILGIINGQQTGKRVLMLLSSQGQLETNKKGKQIMNINNMVFGHQKAKKVLEVLVNRSQKRYYEKCVKGSGTYPDPLKCLLVGQSGTGKTHLVESMSRIHKFPLLRLDATNFSPSGCTSGMTSESLEKLISSTAKQYLNDIRYHSQEGVLNQMVVFVDEFDKLGTSFESTGNWNKHTQSNFLTLIDNKDKFSGISWIFAGAFSSLYERETSKELGFFRKETEETKQEFSDKDILKAGIIPEMLGRINLIVQLDNFTIKDFETVLVERLLPKFPTVTEIDTFAVAKTAWESGQGIRSLTRQLEMLSIEEEFKLTREML